MNASACAIMQCPSITPSHQCPPQEWAVGTATFFTHNFTQQAAMAELDPVLAGFSQCRPEDAIAARLGARTPYRWW